MTTALGAALGAAVAAGLGAALVVMTQSAPARPAPVDVVPSAVVATPTPGDSRLPTDVRRVWPSTVAESVRPDG